MITIVACTYNDSDLLPTCLKSCIEQDVDKEIILVDDCSTMPMNAEVTKLVNAHGIKLIRHDQNMGLSASRNTGIAAATREWVVPIDADDWFYPGALRRLWENSGTDIDVVTGNCTDSGTVYAPAISREPLTVELFKRENPLICSSLFTKEIWSRAGGYMVRKGPHYEDWNFWSKCFAKGARFRHLPFNVYNHTSRPNSMLRQLHPEREKYIKIATEGVF